MKFELGDKGRVKMKDWSTTFPRLPANAVKVIGLESFFVGELNFLNVWVTGHLIRRFLI